MDLDTFVVGKTFFYKGASELELGSVAVPSGRLRIRDPFFPHPGPDDGCLLIVAPGTYRVWVTLVEIPALHDETELETREAYLSIGLNDRTPTGLDYADALLPSPRPSFGAMTGTDSGNIAVFDDTLTDIDRQQLSDELDAHHPLPELYANIAVGDRNIVCSHSGYGDGAFNILLTYDLTGPIAIHIDFGIFDTDEDNEDDDG